MLQEDKQFVIIDSGVGLAKRLRDGVIFESGVFYAGGAREDELFTITSFNSDNIHVRCHRTNSVTSYYQDYEINQLRKSTNVINGVEIETIHIRPRQATRKRRQTN